MSSSWCTIDSDPDVFRTLIREFKATGFDVKEVVELELLPPKVLAFIFCHRLEVKDEQVMVEPVKPIIPSTLFFANQVISNACGTQAILHALLNIETLPNGASLGHILEEFKEFTRKMTFPVRGLCISNCPIFKDVHNQFARFPFSDELEQEKLYIEYLRKQKLNLPKSSSHSSSSSNKRTSSSTSKKNTSNKSTSTHSKRGRNDPPKSKSKNSEKKGQKKKQDLEEEIEELELVPEHLYHFVTYVPHANKVWELDGLQRYPKLIVDLSGQPTKSTRRQAKPLGSWEEEVVKYLRNQMETLEECNLEFNLLAIVPDEVPKLQSRLNTLESLPMRSPEEQEEYESLEREWKMEQSCLEDSNMNIERLKFNYLPFLYHAFHLLAQNHQKEFRKLIKKAAET